MSMPAHRLSSWIALVAILLAALAPALNAFAAGSEGAAAWREMCTAAGVVSVPAGDDAPDQRMPTGHCPWCKLHPYVGIPGAPLEFGRLCPLPDFLAGLHDAPLPGGAPDHHPAQPRAPPAVA